MNSISVPRFFSVTLLFASALVASAANKPVLNLDGEIHDQQILALLSKHGEGLVKEGSATPTEKLIDQLDRKTCKLKLPKPNRKRLSAAELHEKSRAGVVIVAQPYNCGRCERTHCQIASGFMLTSDGAFTTSYHVLSNRTSQTMIILTGDGRIAPVREVLAANREADLVILRAEGSAFTPLPLGKEVVAGSPVRVISHPNHHFYSLTEGITSRHFITTRNRKRISMIAITADFAKGSSGAPVFDEFGNVIASVNSTLSSYYDTSDDGHKENLQMVFKNCVASRHLWEMID